MSPFPFAAHKAVKGKRVLITGAGGSIGSELSRQVAAASPACVILLSHSEYPLFTIERELRESGVETHRVLADIRSMSRLEGVFQEYKPEIVFHTAAIKHVPLAEENICEAVMTNITGTLNVIGASRDAEQLVFVSTDKAVRASSVMGATKRVGEFLCAMPWKSPKINIVRLGNVLGSSGSVIPIFEKAIAEDRPLQVTDKDVDRYFMTIDQAVGLIIETVNLTKGSRLFVLDMGEPVNIYGLAKDMIEKAGKDLPIEVIGLRPGEKIHEELHYEEEGGIRSRTPEILQASPMLPENEKFLQMVDAIGGAARTGDLGLTLQFLKQLVPDYEQV